MAPGIAAAHRSLRPVDGRRWATSTVGLLAAVVLGLAGASCSSGTSPQATGPTAAPRTAAPAGTLAPVRHVLVVMIENKSFDTTWGADSKAPYLARTLAARGTLLTNYYGIGHVSLGNYLALISGQAPNSRTGVDCPTYSEFKATGPLDADGQLPGQGCVYPTSVKTLPDQLSAKGLTWKGYLEDMGNDPARDGGTTCAHPRIGSTDTTSVATRTDAYATKHNPFVYFHSIIDDTASCHANVVPLTHLVTDLADAKTAPNFAMISPNLCNDGHDPTCVDASGASSPGGLRAVDRWMKKWMPRILDSATYKAGGTLVVVTADEADDSDASACCNERAGPNSAKPGLTGPGGGRIGALLLSPHVAGGAKVATPYNHYSLLRTIEDFFGLQHLGFAAAKGLEPIGKHVITP